MEDRAELVAFMRANSFAVLVTGIGFLVILYARYYMSPADPVPRFFSFLLAFMGSMLGVVRGGREQTLTIALETAPDVPRDEILMRSRSPFLGAKVWNLSPALADELRVDPSSEGVVIADVTPGSPAQSFGFQKGDVVLSVNNQKIAKTAETQAWVPAGPLPRLVHRNAEMPPLNARAPRWMCACVTPVRPR